MCFRPIEISSRKKGAEFSQKVTVPCGWCVDCLNAKASSWAIRISEEEKVSSNAYFLTLTYNDETIPNVNADTEEIVRGAQYKKGFYRTLDKKDLQKFFKRYRRALDRKYKYGLDEETGEIVPVAKKHQIRYYAVGEYGGRTKRPHYHAIVFNVDVELLLKSWSIKKKPIGQTKAGKVEQGSIRYCTSYIMEKWKYKKRIQNPPFSIMSKGIGKNYIDMMKDYHNQGLEDSYMLPGGVKLPIPRYFKDKIFSDEDREYLGEEARKRAEAEIAGTPQETLDGIRLRKLAIHNSKKKCKV